jgi:putative endonuclease
MNAGGVPNTCKSSGPALNFIYKEKNMYYVYVLLLNDKTTYIGYPSDLKARIRQHKGNKVLSTKYKEPKLVYYEAFKSRKDAIMREKKLKQGQSKRHLIERIHDSINLCE